jgi:hypothetical protein
MAIIVWYAKCTRNYFYVILFKRKGNPIVAVASRNDVCDVTKPEDETKPEDAENKQVDIELADESKPKIEPVALSDNLTGESKSRISKKQKWFNFIFACVLFFVGTSDLITDWYNAISYSIHSTTVEECYVNQTQKQTDERALRFKIEILAACCLSTIGYILETISFVWQLVEARKHIATTRAAMFQELTSGISLIIEDFVMVTIICIDLALEQCNLVHHMKTIEGIHSITFTTVSIVMRAIMCFASCCVCKFVVYRKRPPHCHYMAWCTLLRTLRGVMIFVELGLVVAIIALAYF